MKTQYNMKLTDKTLKLLEKVRRKVATEDWGTQQRLRPDITTGVKRVTLDTTLFIALTFALNHPDFNEFARKKNEDIKKIAESVIGE